MKPAKMLGPAVLATLMAIALANASSAMAESTQLCTTDTNPCSKAATSVHEVSIGKAVLSSDLPVVKCNVLFSSTKVGALAAPQIITGNFKYSSCDNFCAAEEENGPAELKVLKTGVELASVAIEVLIRVTCPFINCAFNSSGLEGHATGALTSKNGKGEVFVSAQELNKEEDSGDICPTEAFLGMILGALTATYIKT